MIRCYCKNLEKSKIFTGIIVQFFTDNKDEFLLMCRTDVDVSELGAKYFAGYQPFINLTVGGQKRSGGDACNDLTHPMMDAVRLRQRVPAVPGLPYSQPVAPRSTCARIVDVVRAGMGFPACHFDDTHIKMMLAQGRFDVEDARDYCLMGCVEPQKSGRLYQWTSTAYTQWPIAIELALNRGRMPLCGMASRWPADLGDLRDQCRTFDEFEAAVKQQTAHYRAPSRTSVTDGHLASASTAHVALEAA